MKVIWQSEIDPYGCRVLKKHWPEVVNHGNIKEINWGNVVRPDVLCGGYPCQPFSTAGKRKGEDDPRHLWPWVRDAISQLRPKYAILENVRGHLSLGGLSVIGELASIGYDAEWRIVSAASVGAPHKRERVIIVAYPHGQRLEGQGAEQQATGVARSNKNKNGTLANTQEQYSNGKPDYTRDSAQPETVSQFGDNSGTQDVAYADCVSMDDSDFNRSNTPTFGESPTIFSFAGGSSYGRTGEQWFSEPDVGRVANGVPSRVDRLRGLGNAVVPQVAEVIGRMVIDYDTNL
jgi:DNA (cytosine-5)-methyltransferase 1